MGPEWMTSPSRARNSSGEAPRDPQPGLGNVQRECVRRRVAGGEDRGERGGVGFDRLAAGAGRGQRRGQQPAEVDLVDVTGGDALPDGGRAGHVGGAVEAGAPGPRVRAVPGAAAQRCGTGGGRRTHVGEPDAPQHPLEIDDHGPEAAALQHRGIVADLHHARGEPVAREQVGRGPGPRDRHGPADDRLRSAHVRPAHSDHVTALPRPAPPFPDRHPPFPDRDRLPGPAPPLPIDTASPARTRPAADPLPRRHSSTPARRAATATAGERAPSGPRVGAEPEHRPGRWTCRGRNPMFTWDALTQRNISATSGGPFDARAVRPLECYLHRQERPVQRGRGSVGRASPCQGEGRGFESRRPLGNRGA